MAHPEGITEHHDLYWDTAPPHPTPILEHWLFNIEKGWRPNNRVRKMGYHDSARFYKVYIFEYLYRIKPILEEAVKQHNQPRT